MASLGSYIFKPKHGIDVAGKIIERFARDHLHWDDAGFYVYWTGEHSRKNLPEGYVEFHIETEGGDFEAFSETCYQDDKLSAEDMTDSLFVLLGEDFWHKDDSGDTMYTFEDRELCEIVQYLSEDGSRVIAHGPGKEAWVCYQSSSGWGCETIDTSDFLFNTHIEDENVFDNRQLTLPLV